MQAITSYMDHLPYCNIKKIGRVESVSVSPPDALKNESFQKVVKEIVEKVNTCTCGLGDAQKAVDHYTAPLVLDKELFDNFRPGEIIKSVTTKIQTMHQPFSLILKFVALKGDINDWAIYCHHPHNNDQTITEIGEKVISKGMILSICPCTPDIFALYRF